MVLGALTIETRREFLSRRNSSGDTVLHIACKEGSRAIVELLIDSGADIGIRNNLNHTPLQIVRYADFLV
jgi:ankyrin repeat protein